MYAGGMLRTLADVAIACVRSVVGLVGATAFTGALMNAASGDQYISILVTADMFGGVYRAKGVESRMLSRRSFAVLFRGEFWYNSSHETVQRSKEASEMVPREEARGREDRPCADDGVSA